MQARPTRRRVLTGLAVLAAAPVPRSAAAEPLDEIIVRAGALPGLHGLIVAHDGKTVVGRALRGPGLDAPVNIKSLAKTLMAALVGIAIARGVFAGVDQSIAELLPDRLPLDPDPRLRRVTLGHLLSMQAGLERTSGPNYGAWVTSDDWVRHALSRPFVAEPGGPMLYSTGNSHLLSAALTAASGQSTLALARAWLGQPLGVTIPAWQRDPQGVYFGGNNMALAPTTLLRFGETVRNRGLYGGARVLPAEWIAASWTPRTRSPYTGDAYGYGWFIRETSKTGASPPRRRTIYYGWGYGGQMLYLVPDANLTIVVTSDPTAPSGRTGYAAQLHRLVAETIVPAFEAAAPT